MTSRLSPSILFRRSSGTKQEFEIANQIFPGRVFENRSEIPAESLILPRYSCLPYYKELQTDVIKGHSLLIQTYESHKYIADFEWYDDLKPYTFRTYTDRDFFSALEGPYVVKGKTNSRKFQWNKLMYAPNKEAAVNIAADLKQDSLLQSQDIIYRQYIPLKTYEVGINGLPFTDEYRFFFLNGKLLSSGYYWDIADRIPAGIPPGMTKFAKEIALKITKANFFALDIATKSDGFFILVEVNDASMSGLSNCNAYEFYTNLKAALHV